MADRGSITLTSGILAQHPAPGSAAIGSVNAGLEGLPASVVAQTYVHSLEGDETGAVIQPKAPA